MRDSLSRALTPAELASFEKELDDLRQQVIDDLGQRDVDHIRGVINAVRYSELAGRVLLHVSFTPLGVVAGVACLSLSKILENMEVGHNLMHGQYDWTHDPALNSKRYEWDLVCASNAWRHYHNYEHHTFTNILGKDRDFGYTITRLTAEQRWRPIYLLQPVYNVAQALTFEWGVALFGLELERAVTGKMSRQELVGRLKPFLRKAGRQLGKDYVLFPALAGIGAPKVLAGNLAANVIRNVWAYAIISCGHFTADTRVYTEEETRNESRGQWYLRQLHGSGNIEGSRRFYLLSGHLSHQIEHHLFPDIPAHRYPEIAPKVRAICDKYGQHYNTGPFLRQFGSVLKRIVKYSLPIKSVRGDTPQSAPPPALKTKSIVARRTERDKKLAVA
ncbi:acyl-CoA desaturase [Hahella sp. HN01]|uniref:fatty acid desaturase family protein n=1 Tax=Hahella sp. HN01 TaxID=2847262 RepID=UPI001C1F1136|nr:acyl-CoA desaturase [Hahella sp. HN01]MBU6953635.1 acyl-CoA desaturase [Hahella sp. HN01]